MLAEGWRKADCELCCLACGERITLRRGEVLPPPSPLPIGEPRLEGSRTATERVLALRGLKPAEIAKRTRVGVKRVNEILYDARRKERRVH